MYNTIVTVCHLVSDPELKQIGSDKKVCKMRVCVSSQNAKTKNFIDVEAWDRQAEVCSQYLKKGREILIQGELCMDTWEKEGKKFSKHFIRANAVQFLGGNGGEKKNDQEQSAQNTSIANEQNIPF